MTLEDWIHSQLDLGSDVYVKLGSSTDKSSASLMMWSNKSPGSHFWDVSGNTIKHLAFVGDEDGDPLPSPVEAKED